jgi:hypothetical protein
MSFYDCLVLLDMRLNEAHPEFVHEFEFPVEHERVVDRIGNRPIEAPDGTTESIANILERDSTTIYPTANALFATLIGNVDDAHIGRKFYDDRAPNHDYDSISF